MPDMTPFEYEDADGALLSITECYEDDDSGGALVVTAEGGVMVGPDDAPGAALALYEACGLPSPVILSRPEAGPGGVSARTVRAWLSKHGDGVSIGIGGNSDTLTPDDAEGFAAAVAVLAARARAAEPDPTEVDELAVVIRHELCPHSERIGLRPSESDRTAARAAIRWMNAREARDA